MSENGTPSEELNNRRNPTEKRGRGRPKRAAPSFAKEFGMSKDQAITAKLMLMNMDSELARELYDLGRQGKTTMTVMQATARFPREQQREIFPKLNKMGARRAKRFMEQVNRPPTDEQVAASVWAFLNREFPMAGVPLLQEALALVSHVLGSTNSQA